MTILRGTSVVAGLGTIGVSDGISIGAGFARGDILADDPVFLLWGDDDLAWDAIRLAWGSASGSLGRSALTDAGTDAVRATVMTS